MNVTTSLHSTAASGLQRTDRFDALASLRFTADLRLRQKMQPDQANVARLGWVLLPHQHAVEVGPAAGEPQPIAQA